VMWLVGGEMQRRSLIFIVNMGERFGIKTHQGVKNTSPAIDLGRCYYDVRKS